MMAVAEKSPRGALPPPTPRSARARFGPAYVGWLIIVIIIAVGAATGVHRALRDRPDWQPLCTDVRYVWEHGHTSPGTSMFGYLPATTFALFPFMAWLPVPIGAPLFMLTNVIAAAASVWIVWRYWPRPAGTSIFWPVLLASVNFAHALQANQLTMWTLLLCIAGLTLVEYRRGLTGGMVLGLAVALKTLPAFLLGYCLLRRRWRAASGMLLGVILFDFVPGVLYFGWRGAWDEHRAWVQRAGWHSNQQQILDPLLHAYQHKSNFSYSSVLTRWLRETPPLSAQVVVRGSPPPEAMEEARAALRPGEILTLDPMPPRDEAWSVRTVDMSWMPRFHVANWPPMFLLALWAATLAIGLGALFWITWRSPPRGDSWTALAALWMLAIFWPSPMARHYYLAWAFPALVVVSGVLQSEPHSNRSASRAGRILAMAALAGWVIGVACLGWALVRWYGLHLGVLALLTAATVWAWRRIATFRHPCCAGGVLGAMPKR
jgi:hypothetical protein